MGVDFFQRRRSMFSNANRRCSVFRNEYLWDFFFQIRCSMFRSGTSAAPRFVMNGCEDLKI